MSNTATATQTIDHLTSPEGTVTQDTIDQLNTYPTAYEAALAIEMTDEWAMALDERTAPLLVVRAASAHLSSRSLAQDVDEMFRRVMRRQDLDDAYWERAYRGEDLY